MEYFPFGLFVRNLNGTEIFDIANGPQIFDISSKKITFDNNLLIESK